MSTHYPPDGTPVYPVKSGDVFVRWCRIWRRFTRIEVVRANQATELCRVRFDDYKKDVIVSMTYIRERFAHAAGAQP